MTMARLDWEGRIRRVWGSDRELPVALVLKERWRAKHAFIDGQQFVFTGSARGLFGNWI